MNAPVALFVYNRLEHTRLTVEALQKNPEAAQTDLIIFSDGPKNQSHEGKIAALRSFLASIDGFKSVRIHANTVNKGLARNIIDGVTRVLSEYPRIIVMEDDLICSPHFLKYMNDALTLYENTEEVASIHGYVYPVKGPLPETFFLLGADCWGWGTWRRGWQLFREDGKALHEELKRTRSTWKFDFNGTYPYTRMLRNQIRGKNSSWAIRWYASAFLKNKVTLYPGRSLINNIGHDLSGTHCSVESAVFDAKVTMTPVMVTPLTPVDHPEARAQFQSYFIKSRLQLLKDYGLQKLKSIFKNR